MKRTMSKLGGLLDSSIVRREPVYCSGGIRHKGSANLSGLCAERGNCRPDVKGEIKVEETTRVRVPMAGPAGGQLVLV